MQQEAGVASPFPAPAYELANDPTPPEPPGVVDYAEALKLRERDIVTQVQERREESRRARKVLEQEWFWYQSLYQNRHPQSYESKLPWQAQIFIPHVQTKQESFKAQIKAALLSQRRFFSLEGTPGFSDIDHLNWLEQVLELLLDKAGFIDEYIRGPLHDGALLGTGVMAMGFEKYVDRSPHIVQVPLFPDPNMAAVAQQLGMPTTRMEVETAARVKSRLVCRHVPLLAAFPDPFAPSARRLKYFIEELQVDECDIDDGIAAGMFDSDRDVGEPAKWDLEADMRELYSNLPESRAGAGRKRHLLRVYYGDFYGPNGKVVLRNWKAVIANNKALLSFGPNDTYRGSIPYLICTPKPQPGRPWGRSLFEAAANMQEELNDLFNLMLDSQTLAVLPVTTTNVNAMQDPVDFGSIEPGKNYKTAGADAIQQVKLSSAPNEAWPMIQKIEQSIDLATSISQISQGLPTSKGRATATEISTTAAASQAHSSSVADDLERNDIERAVELAYELAMQGLDPMSDPDLQALVDAYAGPTFMLDKASRLRLLESTFRVKARGISGFMKKQENVQKTQQAIGLALQMGMPPSNMLGFLYYLLRQMSVDPADVGLPPSMSQAQEIQAAMAAQQAAQAGGSGAGAGSQLPGGAPENASGATPELPAGLPDDGQRAIMAQSAAGV